jgi:hypothetical protein
MVELPAPLARRLRAPGWRDVRLLVGVLLVLVSIVVGAAVVAHSDSTEPMYAARHVLVPGQPLTGGDLRVVRVRLAGQSARYLPATRPPPAGAVVVRSVLSGELVPLSALGDGSSVSTRPVAVSIAADAAHGLRPGALVDVWVAAKADQPQSYEPPERVAGAAQVLTVTSESGVLSGAGSQATVQVLVSDELVPQVLSAVDNGARIDLVPLPGSVPRGGS